LKLTLNYPNRQRTQRSDSASTRDSYVRHSTEETMVIPCDPSDKRKRLEREKRKLSLTPVEPAFLYLYLQSVLWKQEALP